MRLYAGCKWQAGNLSHDGEMLYHSVEAHCPLRKAAEIPGVHPVTLLRREKEGNIRCIRTPTGQRRFPRSEILRLLGEDLPSGRRAVVYARVSSAKQAGAGNLERRRQRLEEYCRSRGYEIVAVIAERASGINEKRKGLARLFRMAREGKIDLVVIEFKDRLGPFRLHLYRALP